jgi:O-antigen ligase
MIVISLSRSFWMGLVAGGLSILILGVLAHKKMVWRSMLKAILGSVAAVIVIGGVIYFPLPATKDISFASMIKDRGNLADAAGSSRWNLLPAMWQKIGESPILGHGFGSTITYKSQDPRVLQNNPDGIYTTYAFEWGWLAFWVKFGIFGPLVMLVLLISLGWRSWKSDYDWWLRAGMVGSLIALATVHIFTPYLDHPLGFATLLAIEAFLAMSRET